MSLGYETSGEITGRSVTRPGTESLQYDPRRMSSDEKPIPSPPQADLSASEKSLPFMNLRSYRVQLTLAIVIFVFPSLMTAIGSWTTEQSQPSLMWWGVSMIGTSLATVAAMLLLIAASGSSPAEFGIIRDHPVQDVFTGMIWTLGQFWLPGLLVGTIAVIPGLQELDAAVSPERPVYKGSIAAWSVYVLGIVCNSFAEELAMRGVIFTRIRLISGSAVHATIWSSALFASYHIYQGVFATAQVFVSGVLFCLAFIVHRSVWVGIIAHTAVNILFHAFYD